MKFVTTCFWFASWLVVVGMAYMPTTQAAVTAGGLMVVGYDDYHDSVTLVATEGIAAGEVIYLTNNGWSNAQGKFNGAHPAQGAGNESLMKLTITSDLAPGTLISSTDIGLGLWSWTSAGIIPGQVGGLGSFSSLALDSTSDQIYLFQGAGDNPLLNPSHFIFALHFGGSEYPEFSDSSDVYTGGLPPGLSLGSGTALVLPTTFHGDEDGNHSAYGLNLSNPAFASLQASGGSKAEWLQALASTENSWSAGSSLPNSGSLAIHAPEPSRAMLLLGGLLVPFLRRSRIK